MTRALHIHYCICHLTSRPGSPAGDVDTVGAGSAGEIEYSSWCWMVFISLHALLLNWVAESNNAHGLLTIMYACCRHPLQGC